MNSDLLESVRISTKKHQSLIDLHSSALASATKALRLGDVMSASESVLSTFDRYSIWDNHYDRLGDVVKQYEATLNPAIPTKSDLLSVSEQISQIIASYVEPFSMRNISSLGSVGKMFELGEVMKDHEVILGRIDTKSIWDNHYDRLNEEIKNYQAALDPAIKIKSDLLSISEQYSKTIASYVEPFSMKNISSLGSVGKMFELGEALKAHESILGRIDTKSIWNNHFDTALQTKISDLVSVSNGDLVAKMIESMQQQPVAVLNADYVPSQLEIVQATEILYEETDQQSFLEQFNKLPAFLQAFILYIIMSFLIPITNNIAANLLTPIVQEYVMDIFKSNTDKVRNIKAAPSKITHTKIDTSHLRFITAQRGLNVRSLPSTQKSSIIKSTASFGTIVEVLDKRKNWIKISYKVDGETVKGWVFTRYTKRFEK